jgi:hypothetical protein
MSEKGNAMTDEQTESTQEKKRDSNCAPFVLTGIAGVMILGMVILGAHDCGEHTGRLELQAEMLLTRACKVHRPAFSDFMDDEGKKAALACHGVEICLHIDGKVTRCNSVTCETGDRCR